MSEKTVKVAKSPKAAKAPIDRRNLTLSQKAEAAALWKSGSVTLEALGKRFKKRPQAFSRLFKKMGIEKGADVAAAIKKVTDASEARMLTSTEETLKKILAMKDDHFKMASGLARLAWNEIVRAKTEKIDIASLKELMITLKLAGEVISNGRKEISYVLNVEKHDKDVDPNELPELTVRELTGNEVVQLREQNGEGDLDSDMGVSMMPEDPVETL